ncbi:MAG TPA: prolyl oligopeptidase family serine peptidase, partial [Opitutaceae bacterium]|nr:prolyl oligopeptidase family serine peptidase [Opitutaceae bacterium]
MDGGPADIAPDGRHVAYALREKGEVAVYFLQIDSAQTVFRAAVGRDDGARMVGNTRHVPVVRVVALHWVDNDRVVVATTANHFLVLNHRTKEGRHLINLNGEQQVLGAEFGVLAGFAAVKGRSSGRIVAISRARPAAVFVEAVRFGGLDGADHVVFRLDVETGRSEVVYDERTQGSVIYDATGGVRARVISNYWPGAVFLHEPDLGRNKWQPLEKKFPAAFTPAPPLKVEDYLGERSFPLGFDGDVLVYASNRGRKTLGIYGLNLTTGEPTSLVVEDDAVDLVSPFMRPESDLLVVDRTTRRMLGITVQGTQASTRWLEPQFAALQSKLEARARGYSVQIVGWDDARARFVVELHHRADPGGYYVYMPADDKLRLILPRGTQQKSLPRVTITAWTLPRADRSSLSGWLVTPAAEAATPRPVVVRLQTVPWFRATNGYSPEVLALAQMGFAVLEVNHRGISGFGTSHLQAGRHRPDEAAVEDIVAAVEALPPASGADPQRVALLGEDYGGFLALRALQLRPGRFVAAVTRGPITDLTSWMAP